jgi:MFS family permease
LICESKSRKSFLGASYFIGVIIATAIIPVGYLSDLYGRKWVVVLTNFSEITACYGFIKATTLDELYINMLILGMGHPGRVIVAINYGYEFITEA